MKFPKKLLAIDTNAKTVKGQKLGYMTGILYMAPSNISGHQVCPMAAIAACEKACLYTAGRGAFNSVQQSRINKAKLFHAHTQLFMENLANDIKKLIRKAEKAGMIPLVRLNGTSDIRWENIRFDFGFGNEQITLFELFPDIQFYDYTKLSNRKNIPSNYDLTFSYSGTPAYQKYVNQAISAGMRIAVVFRNEREIPVNFLGLKCIGGDNSDIRHIESQNVVVALYAKGQAKTDKSGFVVDAQAVRIIPIQKAA